MVAAKVEGGWAASTKLQGRGGPPEARRFSAEPPGLHGPVSSPFSRGRPPPWGVSEAGRDLALPVSELRGQGLAEGHKEVHPFRKGTGVGATAVPLEPQSDGGPTPRRLPEQFQAPVTWVQPAKAPPLTLQRSRTRAKPPPELGGRWERTPARAPRPPARSAPPERPAWLVHVEWLGFSQTPLILESPDSCVKSTLSCFVLPPQRVGKYIGCLSPSF